MSSFLPSLSNNRGKKFTRKTSASAPSNSQVNRVAQRDPINKIFDQYRDPNDVDTMDMNGTMQYLTALGLDPEDPVFLVLAYCLSSPSLGILTRQGFVDGWRRLGCDTLQSMAGKVNELREQAKIDNEFHKRVYLFTYAFARPEGQRALPLDMAIEYWKLLLRDRYTYLDLWIEFLRERYNKTIPKDTWNLLYDFIEDIGIDFGKYDEDGAWPVIIDEFVAYGKEKVQCGYEDKMMED